MSDAQQAGRMYAMPPDALELTDFSRHEYTTAIDFSLIA